ncbi:MAG: ABC transporter permease [bacterium]
MRFWDLLKTGLQNIWRRRLRSVLTIIAVLIGSTAVVALLILATGARNVFIGQLESLGILNRITIVSDPNAEVDVFGGGNNDSTEGIKLTEELLENIASRDHITAITPVVGNVPFKTISLKDGNDKKFNFYTNGIRPDPAFDLNLSAGRNLIDNEDDMGNIVIGYSFVEKFEVNDPEDLLGKTVIFTTWEGYYNIDMELPPQNAPEEEWKKTQEITATVVGVTASGPSESESMITEAWARRLNTQKWYDSPTQEEMQRVDQLNKQIGEEAGRIGHKVREDEWIQPEPTIEIRDEVAERGFSTIFAQVDDVDFVEEIAAQIEEDLGVGAVTAEEFLESIMGIFTVITAVLAAIGGIALLVAAVGIVNTMVMAVMERTKEIGIMKAVGASKRTIRWMFTWEAGLLGFWGGVFGIGLGYGLTLIANVFVNSQLSNSGLAAQNVARLEWWLALSVVGFTTVIGIIAGLYPASRAARLDPVDALRRD